MEQFSLKNVKPGAMTNAIWLPRKMPDLGNIGPSMACTAGLCATVNWRIDLMQSSSKTK